MQADALLESRFLRGSDLEGRAWTLTIADVRLESLLSRYGPERKKGIVRFEGAKKELVLNRTNLECFKALFGRETDAWIDKRVTLHAVPYEGDLAIRVLGSPDLAVEYLEVTVALPQRRPVVYRLERTSASNAERREREEQQQPAGAGESAPRYRWPSSDESPKHVPSPTAGAAARSAPRLRPVPQPQQPTTRRGGR